MVKFVNKFKLKSFRKIITRKNITAVIKKKPFVSFFVTLVLLFILIVLGSVAFKPNILLPNQKKIVKEVSVYKIGTAPRMVFQGQVENTGVIKIEAQTPGIIQLINVDQGQQVDKGANLINIATNYQGGNAAEVQSSMAYKQYQFNNDNFNAQKDIITKQRDLANLASDNTNNLATISAQTLNDTNNLINLNNDILNTLNSNLNDLKNNNQESSNSAAILQTQEMISQAQAGQNQLLSAQRNLQYQTNTDNPPQKLSDTQKDLTLKQLDIQEKSLQLNKDISQLQSTLAAVNAALYHPTAPFAGIIDRIYVRVGQTVNPGTPLVSLNGNNKNINIIVKAPLSIINKVSRLEPSLINLNGEQLSTVPTSISTEATDGQLYSIIYTIPAQNSSELTDGSFINVEIPIGLPDTNAVIPFIPLDAVFQTEQEALVYVVKNGRAKSKDVKLGDVLGGYVQILSGLSSGDQVILNRNVISQDLVKITND